MRYLILIGALLALTIAASATTDIVGPFGSQLGIYGFTGRFPIVGRVGNGGGGGGGGNCIEYQVSGCILYNSGSSNSILVQ